jgi:hypothetical protein
METTQTFSTVANISDITNGAGLPSNYVQAIDLTNTTSGQEGLIPYKNIREIDFLMPDPDDTTLHPAGNSLYWYYYAQTIRLNPVPAGVYTLLLRYYKKPTSLSADTDVPSIPSQFEELLVVGATYRINQVKDNYDVAAIYKNSYDELLQKLVMQSSQKQIGFATRMRLNKYQTSKPSF